MNGSNMNEVGNRKATVSLPDRVVGVEQLDELLSEPPAYLVHALAELDGDVLILGAAGKMGPTLARMAKRSLGTDRKVIAASRFSNPLEQKKLNEWGVETHKGDLLDEQFLESLPDAANVIYMAGMKFGATGAESMTWAMNTLLPTLICQRYSRSRIAAFSTGNVYGLSPATGGGSVESDPLMAVGDYAMSCVGRERMFEHFSATRGTPVSILRLNYACELRYGVIVDLARKVFSGEPIDVTMGSFNAIWQGDANAMALASLAVAQSPALALNLAGPEQLGVRSVCKRLAELLDRDVTYIGKEASDAILSNGQLGHRLFGYPRVPVDVLIEWIADWVKSGGESLAKPTHFETRDGKY